MPAYSLKTNVFRRSTTGCPSFVCDNLYFMPATLDPLISEFATDEEANSYDRWFRAKVQAAIDSKEKRIPHDQVMAQADIVMDGIESRPGANPG